MIRNMTRSVLIVTMVIALFSCVSTTVNHYQDANLVGKGKANAGVSVGFGRGIAGIANIDEDGYVAEEGESTTSFPMATLGFMANYGITDKIDAGAELYTTLFSTGGKVFGKYQILDNSSTFQVAVLAALGLSKGETTIETSGTGGNFKTVLTHNLFSVDLPLLVSYSFNSSTSFTLSPKLYFYRLSSRDVTEDLDAGTQEKFTASQNVLAPALSVGFRYKSVSPEITYTAVKNLVTDETEWMPLIGIGFYNLEGISRLLSGLF